MSQPYTGEIRLVASNFAPINWHFCDGSLLPISQYEVLYTLLGTTYGGDGVNTFGLPDLRGRVPVHSGTSRSGSNFIIGQIAGQESGPSHGSATPRSQSHFIGLDQCRCGERPDGQRDRPGGIRPRFIGRSRPRQPWRRTRLAPARPPWNTIICSPFSVSPSSSHWKASFRHKANFPLLWLINFSAKSGL